MLDLLIKGGTVVDGTGRPGEMLDVGVDRDRVVAVGRLDGAAAAHTIDARDCVVAPGFIDCHAHSDFTLLVNRRAESSVRQGVTTELVGNCGMGCSPLARARDLPLVCLDYLPNTEPVTWATFGQWLERLETGRSSINVAALAGHGPIRQAVLAGQDRTATPPEIARMVALAEECLDAGAFGISSGLEYNPGKNADTEELVALARVAARHGGLYATHIRNRDYAYHQALSEAIETAKAADVSLQISHIAPRWGSAKGSNSRAFQAVEDALGAGLDVWMDNHPFLFGRGLVISALPPAAFVDGLDAFRTLLQDRAGRRALKEYPNPQWKHWKEGRWDLLTIYDAPHTREVEGHTVQELAETGGKDPWDVVCDLLLAEWQNPAALYWSAPIHRQEDVDASFRHPRCLVMSDGSSVAPYGPYAEVRHIYAYGWASNLLRSYVRERGLLTLPEAVHRITGRPAARLGLRDRGLVESGKKADLVVFEPGTVADRATFDRPIAYADGIRHVWVNGVHTVADGEHTGALAGTVFRHPA